MISPSAGDRQTTLSLRKVQALLGLPVHVVVGLIDAGVVTPTRGPRHAWRFTFQDVVLLRTAHRLRTAQVPSRKLLRALARVKGGLSAQPLSGVRLSAVDRQVVVQEGPLQWEAESGQMLMDFDGAASPADVHTLEDDAESIDWFARGAALEEADPSAAERAYRQALDVDAGHVSAALNLSALLCEEGRCDDALEILHRALRHRPDDASLHFNLGIALEDQRRIDEAIAAYERSLSLQNDLADAHFNLARLHEKAGRPHRTLRHLQEYRRLVR